MGKIRASRTPGGCIQCKRQNPKPPGGDPNEQRKGKHDGSSNQPALNLKTPWLEAHGASSQAGSGGSQLSHVYRVAIPRVPSLSSPGGLIPQGFFF
jgi:hypothetical protein